MKVVGAWRSPVAHSLGVREVGRSNRLAPTSSNNVKYQCLKEGETYTPKELLRLEIIFDEVFALRHAIGDKLGIR